MFSLSMGFFLCGIADEPFCPFPKGSMASSTSVFWRCRISVAIFSRVDPTTAIVEKNCACRSRWMICVLIGAGLSPSILQAYSSTSGGILANVPTAPDILP